MKRADLKVEDHLALSSSAKFNKSGKKVSEYFLNDTLIDVANESNSCRVYLNKTAFLFIFLNKNILNCINYAYLDELLIFSESWQLLVLELSCFKEFLADEKI